VSSKSDRAAGLVDRFRRAIDADLNSHDLPVGWQVGFSGGADSTALLLLASRLAPEYRLVIRAVHVHHGMHPDADLWVQHCRQVCQDLNLDIEVLYLDPSSPPGNETEARSARYRVLAEHLRADELLLLAHHRDDQIETALLNLIRGTGLDGLCGMPVSRPIGKARLLRPLLGCSRQELRSEVEAEGLDWIEDPGNQSPDPARNALRHEVLPRVVRRWPAAAETMSRSLDNLAQARAALDSSLAEDLGRIAGPRPNVISLSGWLELPESRRPLVLRYWLKQLGLPGPDHRHLAQLMNQIDKSRKDAMPLVEWPGSQVRRFRDQLHASPPLVRLPPGLEFDWQSEVLVLPANLGRLYWLSDGEPATTAPRLQVRFRRGGERLQPHDHAVSRDLKTLMQGADVPPWERDRIPLLYRRGELLSVGDLYATESWLRWQAEAALKMVWDRS
jgi:tRNA(Ile)-lysidine synthase